MKTISIVLVLVSLALVTPSCDPVGYPPYDRAALLRETAETVIVPGYAHLESSADDLSTTTTALCASPSTAALTTTRDAWRTTFLAWSRTQGYAIGPAYTMMASNTIGFRPAATDGIEADIAGTHAIDAAWIASLLASHRGLYALEYLLFAGASDDAVVTALADARRCEFVVATAQHIAATTTAISAAWDHGSGNFLDTFENPGGPGDTTYSELQAPIDDLVQRVIDTLKNVNSVKLAIPLGLHTGMPVLSAIESPYANASVEAMSAELAGIREVWAGPTHSLSDLLRTRNATLADRTLGDMDAAAAALSAIPEPLSSYASASDHAAATTAHQRIEALETSLAADVASTLGLSVVYSGADMD